MNNFRLGAYWSYGEGKGSLDDNRYYILSTARRDGATWLLWGKLFHKLGAAMEKTLSLVTANFASSIGRIPELRQEIVWYKETQSVM